MLDSLMWLAFETPHLWNKLILLDFTQFNDVCNTRGSYKISALAWRAALRMVSTA